MALERVLRRIGRYCGGVHRWRGRGRGWRREIARRNVRVK